MRLVGKLVAAVALAAVSTGPVAAAPAAKLSLSQSVRAPTAVKKANGLAGAIVPIVVLVGIIAGAVIVATDDDENPASP